MHDGVLCLKGSRLDHLRSLRSVGGDIQTASSKYNINIELVRSLGAGGLKHKTSATGANTVVGTERRGPAAARWLDG